MFVGLSQKGQTVDETSWQMKHLGQAWVIVQALTSYSASIIPDAAKGIDLVGGRGEGKKFLCVGFYFRSEGEVVKLSF